jgi:hypothetical protein
LNVIGPLGYILWIATGLLQAAVVVCAVRARCFFRFFPLNFYMVCACVVTVGRYGVFSHYGLASTQYFYYFYYSDLLLTICLYFALTGLFTEVFREMGASKYVRACAALVLLLTALLSFVIVHQAQNRLFTKFVIELSQNLYFVGAIFTYLLWGAMLKLKKTQTRLIHIVLALGVYFNAFAANYALYNMHPNSPTVNLVSHFLTSAMPILLPLAWGYAFLKFPAEAQLAPVQIATGHA